jgi:hypothetical protein
MQNHSLVMMVGRINCLPRNSIRTNLNPKPPLDGLHDNRVLNTHRV